MKILKLIIPNFQQFRNFELDLTHPETGEALEKVCLIGTNGTGKSTILEGLNKFLSSIVVHESTENYLNAIILFETNKMKFYKININLEKGNVLTDIKRLDSIHYMNATLRQQIFSINQHIYDVDLLKQKNMENEFLKDAVHFTGFYNDTTSPWNLRNVYEEWNSFKQKYQEFDAHNLQRITYKSIDDNFYNSIMEIDGKKVGAELVIHAPAETGGITFENMPETNVSKALQMSIREVFHHVSNKKVALFWTHLISLIKQREDILKTFAQENKKKTYEEIETIFDLNNPEILQSIAELWDKILQKIHLYFDYKNAEHPVQLFDNLQVYIKTKNTNEIVPFKNLSFGIQNFILRIGHIYSLYFNKNIENGFLLVDEPENSLFPDFLYDLIDIYLEIIGKNTQFFVATHNPIIASQFEPYERVILRFDDEGFVQAHRGESPVGDDPNDLLENDFAVRNLMPRQGRDAFKTYQNLRRTLRETTNEAEKEDLMTAIATLGRLYNF